MMCRDTFLLIGNYVWIKLGEATFGVRINEERKEAEIYQIQIKSMRILSLLFLVFLLTLAAAFKGNSRGWGLAEAREKAAQQS